MRIAAWLSIVFAVLSAIAIFLPGIELQVGGMTLGKRAKVSLYTAARDRDVVKTLIERYHALGGKATGEKAADFVLAHARKHASKAHVDDARDAMSTLDEVHGSDIELAGRALVGVTLGYLAVVVAFVLIMFGATDEAKFSRKRAIAGLVVALVLAAVAVAVHVGWSTGLAEANDEIGGEPFVLGIGADLMPLGALAALGCTIASLVLLLRAKRDAKPA